MNLTSFFRKGILKGQNKLILIIFACIILQDRDFAYFTLCFGEIKKIKFNWEDSLLNVRTKENALTLLEVFEGLQNKTNCF